MFQAEQLAAPGTKYSLTCFSPQHQGATRHGQELFHETLKDIYFAEKKILSALPKMAKAAQSQELKAAFEKHETETEEHVARLEKVFEEIDECAGRPATPSWESSRKARK